MLRVLIVDDSNVARKRVRATIEESKNQIVGEASDGNEALVKFKDLNPNLVITDIEMPNMNGITLTEEIRKIDKNVEILAVSSIANQQVQQYLKIEHFVTFLQKPVKADQLMNYLTQLKNK